MVSCGKLENQTAADAPGDAAGSAPERLKLLQSKSGGGLLAAVAATPAVAGKVLNQEEISHYRLHPKDAVLEYRLALPPGASLVRWVPVLLSSTCVFCTKC